MPRSGDRPDITPELKVGELLDAYPELDRIEQVESKQKRYRQYDVKEQQASYDISVADEIIATNNLSNTREALRVIINQYPEKLKVAREDIPLTIPEPMDIDSWVEKSLESNHSLLAAKYAVDAAQSAYDASKGGHYPSLNLNASYAVVN